MFVTHSYYYKILIYSLLFFSFKEGNKLTLQENIKDEPEDVIEDEGEWEQTIHDQDKVKKETENILVCYQRKMEATCILSRKS